MIKIRSSIDVSDLIGCIFLYLKLVGEIGWSWWWVLAPFWSALLINTIREEIKKENRPLRG
jgi:hypothetical protein